MSEMFPELPPEQEAAIRDLLGSLEAPAMPADVQARLDAVIAEQAAARSGSGSRSGAGRNVRRLALAWVGAAAAAFVIVAGIGVIGQQLRDSGSSADSMSAQHDSIATSAVPGVPSPSALSGERDATSELSDKADQSGTYSRSTPVVIRPGHVAEDASRLLKSDQKSSARVAATAPAEGCVVTREQRRGVQVFAVSFKGEPAVLIVSDGPPRTASVWSCGDELLKKAVLPK